MRSKAGRFLTAGAAVLLIAGTAVAVPQAGRFLIADDPFQQADAALVLSGDAVRRTLAARDLYRQGRVKRILIIPEPPPSAADRAAEVELIRLGLKERPAASAPSLPERILTASGIPQSAFTVLSAPADGTIVEALRVRRFLHGRCPPTLVLITSKASSRRARFIFRFVLSHEPVTVLSHPTSYDAFKADQWWSPPKNALTVVTEYQKLIANGVTLMLGLAHE